MVNAFTWHYPDDEICWYTINFTSSIVFWSVVRILSTRGTFHAMACWCCYRFVRKVCKKYASSNPNKNILIDNVPCVITSGYISSIILAFHWTYFHIFTFRCWIIISSGLTWWRHERETFSALLAICAGNSPVPKGQWRGALMGFLSAHEHTVE